MKLELIRTGLEQEAILYQIPYEILDPLEQDFIEIYKAQKQITDKPTLRTVAHEMYQKWESDPMVKNLLSSLHQSRVLDTAEAEIAVFKLRSKAIFKLLQQAASEEDLDPKERNKILQRVQKLSEEKEEQYHKPVNATNWQVLTTAEEEEIWIGVDWFKNNAVPFKKKVFYSFIATTNGGKTILKTWIAHKLIEAHKNVLYLAQEEPYSDTIRRIHQITLGLSETQYAKMTKKDFKEVGVKYINESTKRGYGQFFVAEWPGIKISTIKDKILEYREQAIEIDALVVDYGKLVDTSTTKKNQQEWERIGSIFQELKQLAMDLNIVVITSVQLNRISSQKLVKNGIMADLFDVAGAYEAMQAINYVWSVRLQQNSSEDIDEMNPNSIQGMYTLMVQKQKYGKLRKGDSRSFRWKCDHSLEEVNVDMPVILPTPDTEETYGIF